MQQLNYARDVLSRPFFLNIFKGNNIQIST